MTAARRLRAATLLPIAAVALLLIVPFWSFLHFNGYAVKAPESLAIAAVLGLIGAAYGLLIARARSPIVRTILTAVALLVGLDLLANIGGLHFALLVVTLGVSWLLRDHVHEIVVAVLVAMGVSTVFFGARDDPGTRFAQRDTVSRGTAPRDTPRRDSTPNDSQGALRPPLLHLIADEHVGVEGIPTGIGAGDEARRELTEYYVSHGFRLFTRAYSPYHLTADVLPNLFNFAERPFGYIWLGGPRVRFPPRLTRNEYFQRLSAAGFDVRMYQPKFIDFCRPPTAAPVRCHTTAANSIRNLRDLPMRWPARIPVLAGNWFATKSSLYKWFHVQYNKRARPAVAAVGVRLPEWEWARFSLGPAGALAELRQLEQDMRTAPDVRGQAFVAHVLLPHSPYFIDERCAVTSDVVQPNVREAWPNAGSVGGRRRMYEKYLPQLRCMTRRVSQLVELLETRGGPDAVVIVQGDHGSRIGALPDPRAPLTREDFEDYYSTLFAVRAPGVPAGIDTSTVTTKDLLDRFTRADFANLTIESNSAPHLYRVPDHSSGKRVREPVPARWRQEMP